MTLTFLASHVSEEWRILDFFPLTAVGIVHLKQASVFIGELYLEELGDV